MKDITKMLVNTVFSMLMDGLTEKQIVHLLKGYGEDEVRRIVSIINKNIDISQF